jgi:hypothetical protein
MSLPVPAPTLGPLPSDEDAWAYEIVAFDEAGIPRFARVPIVLELFDLFWQRVAGRKPRTGTWKASSPSAHSPIRYCLHRPARRRQLHRARESSAATEPLCVDYAQGYGIARPAPVADVFPGEIRQTADGPWDPRLPS